MSVGHDPKSDPYRPDMRKDEKNITMEDRREAKRRIEGSLAPDPDCYDVE
jgi:phosphatidylserine decarboxylase